MDVWYQNAIIYGIDVKTFFDGNGDGIGDFEGLIEKLDYLEDLGVTCLWLTPFYPSPLKDNGYDIADYYNVDSRLGSIDRFFNFVIEAKKRGMRVISDLVMNHTSDEHPWFRASRRSKCSRFRDYYVWEQDPPPTKPGEGSIFPGEESGVWEWDEAAGAFYHHRFYKFQPSLRVENHHVQEEIRKVIDYWLCFGLDGLRIDAASHMIEPRGRESTEPEQPHKILDEVRDWAESNQRDVVLMGEADEKPQKVARFFGGGDELNMLLNFLLNNYMFLSLAIGNAEPMQRVLELMPPLPTGCSWANFLRNLDEVDLERLTEEERKKVFAAFAPDEDMRIYGRGIRRRLSPMLGGNRKWLELAFSLMFSLPGAPTIVYGDEIGLGENLDWDGRGAVRTPMQWTSGRNGGFSDARVSELYRKPIADGKFGYRKVNVADQLEDESSLLNWMKKIISVRRSCPEIGTGELQVIRIDDPKVFAHRIRHAGMSLLFLHNMSDTPSRVPLGALSRMDVDLETIFPKDRSELEDGDIDLPPYGYYWLRSTA